MSGPLGRAGRLRAAVAVHLFASNYGPSGQTNYFQGRRRAGHVQFSASILSHILSENENSRRLQTPAVLGENRRFAALFVEGRKFVDRHWLDFVSLARLAESGHPGNANLLHCFAGRF